MIFSIGAQIIETFTVYALEKTANIAWWMSNSLYRWYKPKKLEYDPEALQHQIVDLKFELVELKKQIIDNKHLNNEQLI